MSIVNHFKCDTCGKTAPVPPGDDDESPHGWIFLVTMCGITHDVCSTECAVAALMKHDHMNESKHDHQGERPVRPKLVRPTKNEKPS